MSCYICQEEIIENSNEWINLDCKHPFHIECIKNIRRLRCPTCRKEITVLPPNIINLIKYKEQIDTKRQELENELLSTIIQLRIYERMAESIEFIVK
jgi:hypothetical protein